SFSMRLTFLITRWTSASSPGGFLVNSGFLRQLRFRDRRFKLKAQSKAVSSDPPFAATLQWSFSHLTFHQTRGTKDSYRADFTQTVGSQTRLIQDILRHKYAFISMSGNQICRKEE
uniref:Uncharacterized protein n=1 Tax=Poecilia mexicana TaxID=48701 RepID=A0A3B3Y6B5_9TELE